MINRSKNLLYPPFLDRVETGLLKAMAVDIHAHIFEGYRSVKRQADLFAIGRSAPGKIVTYAKPWQSLHQYGVAVDIVFDGDIKPGTQWDWRGDYVNDKANDYEKLAVILKGQGLEWLGDKNIELAHFQMSFGMTYQQMARITEDQGILGLWAAFDLQLAKNLGVS
jgi:peptidoglycan L-alanyl-D-glutamate endopeptidase CwlK